MYVLHTVVRIHDLILVNNCQTHHHSAISIHSSASRYSPILIPIANFVRLSADFSLPPARGPQSQCTQRTAYNKVEGQVIVEFLLTEPLFGESFCFLQGCLPMLQSSALGEDLFHIKRYILSRSMSTWKGNTIMNTQMKHTEMFDQKEYWNQTQIQLLDA